MDLQMNHIETCLKKVDEIRGLKNWDAKMIVSVGVTLGSYVNSLKDLKGCQKKDLVLAVMRQSLEQAEQMEIAEEVKKSATEEAIADVKKRFESLRFEVNEILPISLDIAVAAARGAFDFRKIEPSFLARLFSCCVSAGVSALANQNVISESQAKQASQIVKSVEKVANPGSKTPAASRRPSTVPPSNTPKLQIS
jgi:hypothetical protein